jgi:hypothetical protein
VQEKPKGWGGGEGGRRGTGRTNKDKMAKDMQDEKGRGFLKLGKSFDKSTSLRRIHGW